MTFLKTHERLIIVILVVVLSGWSYSRFIDYLDRRDQLSAAASQNALQAQQEANKKASDATVQVEQQYQQLITTLISKNVLLASDISKRDTTVKVQQATDKTLSPPALADRWNSLVNGNVVPTETGYQLDFSTAVSTVVQLESVPQLQQDLKDTKTIIVNKDQQITGLNNVVDSEKKQIDGLNLQITDQSKATKDEIALIKAQARKSKLHWFIAGVVVGAAARGAIKLFAGI